VKKGIKETALDAIVREFYKAAAPRIDAVIREALAKNATALVYGAPAQAKRKNAKRSAAMRRIWTARKKALKAAKGKEKK
jgi:hypothetical protein